MATVKYAISDYIADGTTTDYLITWDYLDEDHIAVYVDGTSNADPQANHTFTKLNSTTLRITDGVGGAIPSGASIEIRRETPLTTRAITFADGSALLATDLNKNSDYLLYSMQEVLDTVDAAAQDGALAAEVATEALRDETLVLKNTTAGYLATVEADEQAADAHRIAAAASEAAALASQNASEASENAASASETASANSATASANSATDSAASAAASLASEQAADVSEAAALASENAAAASQAAAAVSETNAATSEANAASSFDSFDDRYLGAKAAAPTVDNDGDALLTGAIYWNSTSDEMYVWNGSSWDTFTSTTGLADAATGAKLNINDTGIGVNVSPTSELHVKSTSSGDIYPIKTEDSLGNVGIEIGQYGSVGNINGVSGLDLEVNKTLIGQVTSTSFRVGNTTGNPIANNDSGTEINTNGLIISNRANGDTAAFGRTSSDGEIVSVWNDGTKKGSIGSDSSVLTITAEDSGYGVLRSNDSSGYVWYTTGSGSAGGSIYPSEHNVRDLGESSSRFRNLYVGSNVDAYGSVYSSGGASKLLGYSTLRNPASFALNTTATDCYIASAGVIPSGTYILLVTLSGGGWYSETWAGLMRWYNSGTNSNQATSIYMTGMGHAPNNRVLYARVQRRGSNAMNQSIQIYSNSNDNVTVGVYVKRLT